MYRFKCILSMTGIFVIAQSGLFLLFLNPDLNWKPFHYFLDWVFAVAYLVPLSLVLSPDCCGGVVTTTTMFLIHLPLMVIYGFALACLGCGIVKLVRSRTNNQ